MNNIGYLFLLPTCMYSNQELLHPVKTKGYEPGEWDAHSDDLNITYITGRSARLNGVRCQFPVAAFPNCAFILENLLLIYRIGPMG